TTERPRDRGVRASLSPAIARMPDQRGYNGKPLCQPSQPPHEYGPGIRAMAGDSGLDVRSGGPRGLACWRHSLCDIAVLTALATLLQDVTSVSAAPSQLRDSSAALGSHDANRGACSDASRRIGIGTILQVSRSAY